MAANDALTAISDETRAGLAPELVLILVPVASADDAHSALTQDPGVLAALQSSTIGLYQYGPDGGTGLHKPLQGDPPQQLPLEDLRRQGMTALFNRRGGVLEAGPTAHFVKPSGRTDTRFLRAAHALSDGAEIFFIAFWLLPLLARHDVRYVHLDSSSIASVALAAVLMRGGRAPVIRTFHSYDGLDDHQLSLDRADMVLISASQSGEMAKKIAEKVGDPALVVTLFSTLGDPPAGTATLCDLRYDASINVLGLHRGSRTVDPKATRAIRLIGEHFTVESAPPRAIVPGVKDAPLVVNAYLAQLQGKGVFRTFRASLVNHQERAVWIDVEAMLQTEVFKEWVRRMVARVIPAATRSIIYFDNDPGSKPLAEAIQAESLAQGAPLHAKLLKLADVEKAGAKADWEVPSSTALVVGGVTGHGAELLAASRALRGYADQSHRLYLTTAAMPSSKQAATLLRSNLQQPDHHFQPMFELFIDRAKSVASWSEELDLLNEDEGKLPDQLAQRLKALCNTSVGLHDDLFLPGAAGPLRLRKNFAFWRQVECDGASQADVFATIAAILENLRSGDGISNERRLVNGVYDRAVLSGETFARYNDGVIQAAILRAAYPIELNYQDAPDESRLVAQLIAQMAELADRPQGEALTEFLLALHLGRLKLCPDDMAMLVAKLGEMNFIPLQKWFVEKLPVTPPTATRPESLSSDGSDEGPASPKKR